MHVAWSLDDYKYSTLLLSDSCLHAYTFLARSTVASCIDPNAILVLKCICM
jgi:hypothetical protein